MPRRLYTEEGHVPRRSHAEEVTYRGGYIPRRLYAEEDIYRGGHMPRRSHTEGGHVLK